jgi:hypothetical protein
MGAVVALGTITNGVLFMSVVLPASETPGLAGTVVGPRTTKEEPDTTFTEPGRA